MMRLREGGGVRKCGELTRESPINRQCVMASTLWQRRGCFERCCRSSGRRWFNRLCPRHGHSTLSRKKRLAKGTSASILKKYSRIDTRKKFAIRQCKKVGTLITDTKTRGGISETIFFCLTPTFCDNLNANRRHSRWRPSLGILLNFNTLFTLCFCGINSKFSRIIRVACRKKARGACLNEAYVGDGIQKAAGRQGENWIRWRWNLQRAMIWMWNMFLL